MYSSEGSSKARIAHSLILQMRKLRYGELEPRSHSLGSDPVGSRNEFLTHRVSLPFLGIGRMLCWQVDKGHSFFLLLQDQCQSITLKDFFLFFIFIFCFFNVKFGLSSLFSRTI